VVKYGVTKIKPTTANPKGAGRKRLPEGRKKLKTSVSLPPDLVEELSRNGGGVLSKGIEMTARNLLVTDSAGKLVGMVHVGPGDKPYQAWTRGRSSSGRGNVHTLLGLFSSAEAAADALRDAS